MIVAAIGYHSYNKLETIIMAATKYAPADWHVSNSVIQSTAERQRNTAHDFRQQSNTERNETGMHIDCNIMLMFYYH